MSKLREMRISKGLSQSALAIESQVSVTLVNRYDRQVQRPSHETALKFAKVLDCSVEDLYPGVKLNHYYGGI